MTGEEKRRYSRQIAIEDFGLEAQEKLLKAKIGIIGCGALGSMVAMQLAGAGVGTLVIGDFDTVDISNLQRQFFFTTNDCGGEKCLILKNRIEALNPETKVYTVVKLITTADIRELFGQCDFLIDATDNASSKIMVDKAADEMNCGCCIGGVSEFHGQIMTIIPPKKFGFNSLFEPDENNNVMPCAANGVMGTTAATCASLMAMEAIKCITGIGENLASGLLTFDLLTNTFLKFSL